MITANEFLTHKLNKTFIIIVFGGPCIKSQLLMMLTVLFCIINCLSLLAPSDTEHKREFKL